MILTHESHGYHCKHNSPPISRMPIHAHCKARLRAISLQDFVNL